MTAKEALVKISLIELCDTQNYKVIDGYEKEIKIVDNALAEHEQLKENITINKNDVENYLNVFERTVLYQIIETIKTKKLMKVGKVNE